MLTIYNYEDNTFLCAVRNRDDETKLLVLGEPTILLDDRCS